MSLLDDRTFRIQLKQGTQSNMLLGTTYLLEGEIVFTTDTLTVFIADGANNKIPINGNVYTVGTLPTGVTGMRAFVSDALTPTFLGALTGGSSTFCPVFYNGSAWKVG
jgi:Major tropism determinant N-terminal domain